MTSDITLLRRQLIEYLQQENVVLFAGAGVSRRAGLPLWADYLRGLADVCDRFSDGASATLIRQKIDDEDFTGAATVYLNSSRVPKGELMKELARPFEATLPAAELAKLEPLFGLGFTAVVTTNFDSVAHNVYTRLTGTFPTTLEVDDGTLGGGTLRTDYFIARIHGRALKPESMRLSELHYALLQKDELYEDFLTDLFRRRRCLFVGFSFADPALRQVLGRYEELLGPAFPQLHAALVPGGDTKLESRLRQLNIVPLLYDSADGHKQLWQLIRDVYDARRSPGAEPQPEAPVVPPIEVGPSTHRLMAFAYAQMQTKRTSARQAIVQLVQDALVLSLFSAGSETRPYGELLSEFRAALGVNEAEAKVPFDDAIGRLVKHGAIAVEQQHFRVAQEIHDVLGDHLTRLAESITTRMKVRYGVATNQADLIGAKEVLESVLSARAWDLAAHFAGAATVGWSADLPRIINHAVRAQLRKRTLSAPGSLERALLDLLHFPEDSESELLATLGRAAFGTQLVLSTPRQALFQRVALPQRVYMDANILMPVIIADHPLHPVYIEVMHRLVQAAKQVEEPLHVIAGAPFIDETIRHRQKAIDLVAAEQLGDPARLVRHLLFFGATRMNAFISGYASHVSGERRGADFFEYLRKQAPYNDAWTLRSYLGKNGIEVDDMRFQDDALVVYNDVHSLLQRAYESTEQHKEPILIRHEAEQLTRLQLDGAQGIRSIFVTADLGLRRALQAEPRLHGHLGCLVSHLGLVALVDVMVGIAPDARAMTRLLWTPRAADAQSALADYFVTLALREYDDAMTVDMQELAQVLARQAVEEAKAMNLDLLSRQLDDVVSTSKLLDTYEDRFFERKAEALAARQPSAGRPQPRRPTDR